MALPCLPKFPTAPWCRVQRRPGPNRDRSVRPPAATGGTRLPRGEKTSPSAWTPPPLELALCSDPPNPWLRERARCHHPSAPPARPPRASSRCRDRVAGAPEPTRSSLAPKNPGILEAPVYFPLTCSY